MPVIGIAWRSSNPSELLSDLAGHYGVLMNGICRVVCRDPESDSMCSCRISRERDVYADCTKTTHLE